MTFYLKYGNTKEPAYVRELTREQMCDLTHGVDRCWCRVRCPEDEYILGWDADTSGRSTALDTAGVWNSDVIDGGPFETCHSSPDLMGALGDCGSEPEKLKSYNGNSEKHDV